MERQKPAEPVTAHAKEAVPGLRYPQPSVVGSPNASLTTYHGDTPCSTGRSGQGNVGAAPDIDAAIAEARQLERRARALLREALAAAAEPT